MSVYGVTVTRWRVFGFLCKDRVIVVYVWGFFSGRYRVNSQARDDFEGFFDAHMDDEEKVIVRVDT